MVSLEEGWERSKRESELARVVRRIKIACVISDRTVFAIGALDEDGNRNSPDELLPRRMHEFHGISAGH